MVDAAILKIDSLSILHSTSLTALSDYKIAGFWTATVIQRKDLIFGKPNH
jgi:hypothetical protein